VSGSPSRRSWPSIVLRSRAETVRANVWQTNAALRCTTPRLSVTLPPRLVEWAALENRVTFVGEGDRVSLMHPSRFESEVMGTDAPGFDGFLDTLQVPQADEQQRLLTNLIQMMNVRRKPLPRFWYLPNGYQAAVINFALDVGIPTERVEVVGDAVLLESTTSDLGKVVEYDSNGNELWSFPGNGVWGVEQLKNGNVLITDREGVREVTRRGDAVWSWSPADAPGYKFANLQQAWRLPNGNTVINSWMNEWNVAPKDMVGTLQAVEVTPAKQVVWALASWTEPAKLGPATTIQFLDDGAAPAEDVHFGEIK